MASMINWIFPLVWLCCYQLGVALDLCKWSLSSALDWLIVTDMWACWHRCCSYETAENEGRPGLPTSTHLPNVPHLFLSPCSIGKVWWAVVISALKARLLSLIHSSCSCVCDRQSDNLGWLIKEATANPISGFQLIKAKKIEKKRWPTPSAPP